MPTASFYTPQDGAEERFEPVFVRQGPQDAAVVEHRLEGIEVRPACRLADRLREVRVRRKKARDDAPRSLPARSSRSRRPGGRPARRRPPRCEASSAARLRSGARSASAAASGCRDRAGRCRGPSRAHRRAPRSNAAANGSPASRSACSTRMLLRAAGADRFAQQLHARVAHVGGDDRRRDRRPSPPSRWSCRQATRRYRARVLPGSGAAEQRHELRRFVLNKELPVPASGVRSGLPAVTMQSVGRIARRLDRRRRAPASASTSASRVDLQAVHAKRQRRRGVVERSQRFGRVESVRVQPACDEPARMRQRDFQIGERDRRRGGRSGSGSRCALRESAAQHRVDEARRRSSFAPAASWRRRRPRPPPPARGRGAAADRR